MKAIKKIFTLLAIVGMLFATVNTVSADTTVTIQPQTPTTPSPDTTLPDYKYWVFMKASVGSDGSVSYYVEDSTRASALDSLSVESDDLFTVTKAAGADKWNVVINKKSDLTAFTGIEVATELAKIKSNAITSGIADKGETNSTITLGYDGYLLIESSLGTKVILDTYTTKTVNDKNTYPGSDKTENKSTAEIGEAVTYTVTVDIPATVASKDIKVVDTITNGLTLNPSITITGSGGGDASITSLSFSQTGTIPGNTTANPPVKAATIYTATIPAEKVIANAGKTLTLTYTATVNENAVVNDPEINKAHIEYDNFKTVDVSVLVKTFGFVLEKVDKTNHDTKLQGVTFTLSNLDGDYYIVPSSSTSVDEDRFVHVDSGSEPPVVATGSDGKISFEGLHAGTYTLTEISNPIAGYNLLDSAITITVSSDGTVTANGGTVSSNVLTVENAKGSIMPTTGGIGTTIFHVAGAGLAIGAAILLISKKRMNNN